MAWSPQLDYRTEGGRVRGARMEPWRLCGEGSGGIMAKVAEKKVVARGVGEEEAERGWRKVLAVAETVRVEERKGRQ